MFNGSHCRLLLSLGQKKDLEGSRKFLDRVYRLITSKEIVVENKGALDKVYNETVKAVTEQIESMKFNTAIAQLMVFVNAANKEDKLYVDYAKGFIQLIAPFAPHLAEELWQVVVATGESISYVAWPTWDESNWLKTKSKSSSKSKEKFVPNSWLLKTCHVKNCKKLL